MTTLPTRAVPDERRVVITGWGAITDLGHDAPATWSAMCAGTSGIGPVSPEILGDWGDRWSVTIAGEVRDWDPAARLGGREAKRLDRFGQMGIAAAIEAVESSGVDFGAEDPSRCGVIIGSGVGGIATIQDQTKVLYDKGPDRLSPFTVPRLMANACSGDVSIRYGLKGPSSVHVTACASSGHSMGDAMRTIQRGEADVMIAGGAEAAICPITLGAFMTMRALSTRNHEPERASRPFDQRRDGFVLAEGAGVFVLESLEHARARGAEILCELVGYCATSDAHHITAPDPGGDGACRAMLGALKDGGLEPTDIDYINAHGTSTPLGDAAEVAAVTQVFGDHARASAGGKLLMSSTKSMVGHCLGASGGVEMVACIGAIRDGRVPPTINCEEPDSGFDLDFVPGEAREAPVRYAMNNTFGFGGHNVTLLVGRFDG